VRGVEKPLYGYWAAQPEVVEAVGKMQDRADELGITIAQAAVQFAVTQPKIDSAVVGITKPAELQQNVEALNVKISRQDLESIAEAGTIDEYFLGGPEFVWPFPEDRKPAELQ
jgi:D-threo-aldose 1-dehydrogenase